MSKEERSIAVNPVNDWGVWVEKGYSQLISRGNELKGKSIAFYDFSMIFENDQRVLYIDDCCHFNKDGNRVVARDIAEIMKDLIQ